MNKNFAFFFLFLFSFSYLSHAQGKIEKAEKSLTKSKRNSTIKTKSSTKSRHGNNGNGNSASNNFLFDLFGELLIQVVFKTVYSLAIESPTEKEHRGSTAVLTKHPYNTLSPGNYSYDWNENSEIFTTSFSNRYIFESNKIYGNHLNADMRFLKRLGLELDYLQLWEENTNFGNNNLAIYTALIKYNRIRTQRFNAWWGIGTAFIDGDVNALGFTFGLGAELFFIKPFSLESHFNNTTINDNSVHKFNALLNYHKQHYKFILGYEHLKIGSVNFSNLTTGLGISF